MELHSSACCRAGGALLVPQVRQVWFGGTALPPGAATACPGWPTDLGISNVAAVDEAGRSFGASVSRALDYD